MGIILKFCGGVAMTLLFVIAVPYVMYRYVTPLIVELVGDNGFLFLSSETLVAIIFYSILIGFALLLGGSAILRWCGVFGVLGMILAYYLLGNLEGAILPVLSLTAAYIVTIPYRTKKEEKRKAKLAEGSV